MAGLLGLEGPYSPIPVVWEPDFSLIFARKPDLASGLAMLHSLLPLHWALLPSPPIYAPKIFRPKALPQARYVSGPVAFQADAIFGTVCHSATITSCLNPWALCIPPLPEQRRGAGTELWMLMGLWKLTEERHGLNFV